MVKTARDNYIGYLFSELENNKVFHNVITFEIISMNEPEEKNLTIDKKIVLFKYLVVDRENNQAALISWGKHINYKTGDVLQISNFYVKQFKEEKQIVVNDGTKYVLLNKGD